MPEVASGPYWICGRVELDRVWQIRSTSWRSPQLGRLHTPTQRPVESSTAVPADLASRKRLPAPEYSDILYTIDWTPESLESKFDVGTQALIFKEVVKGVERRSVAVTSLFGIGLVTGRARITLAILLDWVTNLLIAAALAAMEFLRAFGPYALSW
jgi:hypothetical protein